MEGLSEKLSQLIHQEAHIFFDDKNKVVRIEEPQNTKSTQLRSVIIKGIQNFYFALKLDHEKHKFLGSLINDVTDIKKACDAIIFCQVNNQNYIFLVEMKSDDSEGVAEKIKSTEAFLAFLEVILQNHYKIQIIDNVKIRNILFDRKVNKGKPIGEISKKGVDFLHQGFDKQDNNEAWIRNFIH